MPERWRDDLKITEEGVQAPSRIDENPKRDIAFSGTEEEKRSPGRTSVDSEEYEAAGTPGKHK